MNLTQLLTFREVRDRAGDTLHCPHFRCVTCGEPVDDPEAFVVRLPATGTGQASGEIVVVHRTDECDVYDGRPWEVLEDFLAYLIFNSRVSSGQLRALLVAVEEDEQEDEERERDARDGEAA